MPVKNPVRPSLVASATLVLACATPLSQAASPSSLPIDSGTYVLSGSPRCQDAALVAVVRFDGQSIEGPHESVCTTKLLSRHGKTYRISTTCSAAGDRTPATPYTRVRVIRVDSRDRFSMLDEGKSVGYELCPDFH